jgi:hypothetical protein
VLTALSLRLWTIDSQHLQRRISHCPARQAQPFRGGGEPKSVIDSERRRLKCLRPAGRRGVTEEADDGKGSARLGKQSREDRSKREYRRLGIFYCVPAGAPGSGNHDVRSSPMRWCHRRLLGVGTCAYCHRTPIFSVHADDNSSLTGKVSHDVRYGCRGNLASAPGKVR